MSKIFSTDVELKRSMTKNKWLLLLLIGLGLILSGCDLREGTIVYDVDFPNADSCDASGNCDDGSGSGSGSGGAGSDGGSDNASPGFTLSKTTATVSQPCLPKWGLFLILYYF